MKGIYIGVAIALVLIVLLYVVFGRKGSSKPESVEDELMRIKDKIRNAEGYREYYRSDDNNGLTVGGTILEQGIDVLVEILKQPLVKEFTQKVIQNKEDAVFIAEQIEIMGKEFVSLLKDNQILKCGSPLVKKCEQSESVQQENASENGPSPNKIVEICRYVQDESEPPLDNCKVYRTHKENIKYISETLRKKALDIINDDTKRPEIYTTFKNITMSNYQMLHYATGNEEFAKKLEEGFPTEEEFFTQFNNMNGKVKLPAAKSVVEEETA